MKMLTNNPRSKRNIISALFVGLYLASSLVFGGQLVYASGTPTPIPGGAGAGGPVNVADAVCGGASLNASASARKCPTSDTTDTTLNNVIKTVINLFSLIVGFVSVLMIIYGGFRYITSGGDPNNVKIAKSTILYAIIGLVVVAVAQVLVRIVLVKAISNIN